MLVLGSMDSTFGAWEILISPGALARHIPLFSFFGSHSLISSFKLVTCNGFNVFHLHSNDTRQMT